MSQNYINRQLSLVSQILEHRIFNTTLKMAFSYGKIPDKNEIIKEMKESSLYKVDSEETYKRRASTIRSWLEWIINLIQE